MSGLQKFSPTADLKPVGVDLAKFQKSFQGDIRPWAKIVLLAKIALQ